MKRKLGVGVTSVALPIFVQDTSSTTGGGLSGLTQSTSGLVLEYRRQGQSSWTTVTLAAGTLGTYTSGGIVADGALGGAYEIGIPDAAFATGARFVVIRLRGAANMLPVLIEVELDAINYQDATRLGLTALPNAAAGASGGLPLSMNASGHVTVGTNNDKTGYTASTVSDKTGYSLSSSQTFNLTGNITGNLSGSVGSVTGNVGGNIVGSVNSVATGVTLAATTHTGAVIPTVTNLTNAPTTGDLTATMKTSIQTELTTYGALKPTTPGNTLAVDGSGNASVTVSASERNKIGDSVWQRPTSTTASFDTPGTIGTALFGIANKFFGISQLRNWLALIMGKGTDADTKAEVNLTLAGATYNQATDSLEAIRDNTPANFSTLVIASGVVEAKVMSIQDTEGNTRQILTPGGLDSDPIAIHTDNIEAVTDKLNTALEQDGLVYRFTTNALELAPSGGATASQIADAVWDEILSGHTTSGSAGAALAAAQSAGDPWATALPGSYASGTAGSILSAVKTKTDLITTQTLLSAPVSTRGKIAQIFIGDDYLAANGRAFEWTITEPSGFTAATSTCFFGGSNGDGSTWRVQGSITDLGSTWKLSFDMTKTDTAVDPGIYEWTVEVKSAGSVEHTVSFGGDTRLRRKYT